VQAAGGAALNDSAAPAGPDPAQRPRRIRLLVIIAVTVFVADLVSKTLVVATLSHQPPLRLLGGLLNLRVLRNSGAAFSIGTSMTFVFSLIAESIALARALAQIRDARAGQSLWRWFRTTRQSELLVILGEDIAATIGLTLALVAISIAMLTGNVFWDALGSMAIGVLLILVAIFIGVEVKALLVGQSADPAVMKRMRAFLEARPEVGRVLNLIATQHGEDVVVAVKAQMTEEKSARALIDAINACERALREEFPEVRWLFFEPDVEK